MILCFFLFLLISPILGSDDLIIIKKKSKSYCIGNGENALKAICLKSSSNSTLLYYKTSEVKQFSQQNLKPLGTVGTQVDSLMYQMDFLDDFRWNRLPIHESTNSLPLNGTEILTFNQSTWKISFSILGEKDAYIILAENSSSTNFYYLYFDSRNKENMLVTEIKKCDRNYRWASLCTNVLKSVKNKRLLDLNEWHHFTLSWDKGYFQLWSNTLNQKILETRDKNFNTINSLKIRQYRNSVLWKFHKYKFSRIEETSEELFDVYEDGILFFFYFIEGDATINIFQNNLNISTLDSKKGSSRKWKSFNYQIKLYNGMGKNEIKFIFNKKYPKDEIFIDRILFFKGDLLFSYISINDNIDNVTCYTLDGKEQVNTSLPYAVKNPDCFSEACKTEHSILSERNYEDTLHCSSINRDCRCFPGHFLNGYLCERCPSGKYGLGCENTCGKCISSLFSSPKSCDFITGKCGKCQGGYLTEFCNQTLPVATEPPKLKEVGRYWATLKINFSSYSGVEPYFWQLEITSYNQRRGYLTYSIDQERYIQTGEIEYTLPDLEFSTIYNIWVRYFIKNYDNMYNYNKTISDMSLIFKTSCEATENFDLIFTNTSLDIYEKWNRQESECFPEDYNYVLTSEKTEPINQNRTHFDIEPYTNYNLSIFLNTKMVYSKNFTSLEGANPQFGPDFQILYKNATFVSIYCKRPKNCSEITAPIEGCAILIKGENFSRSRNSSNKFENIEIQDLLPYTNYTLVARIKSENKILTFSKVLYFKTGPSAPGKVQDLLVYNISNNMINIRLRLPDPPNGILQQITIEIHMYYVKKYDFASKELVKCTIWPEMYCLEIDQFNVRYKIYAVNEYNLKDLSSALWINTTLPSEVASEPLNITVSSEEKNFIIRWEHPAQSNGYFQKFICDISKVDSYLINNLFIHDFSKSTEVGQVQRTYNLTIDLIQSTNYTITVYASKPSQQKGKKQTIYYETPSEPAPVPKSEIIKVGTTIFTISFDTKTIDYTKLTNKRYNLR